MTPAAEGIYYCPEEFQMKPMIFLLLAGLILVGVSDAQEKSGDVKGWGKIADPQGDCQFIEKDGKLTIKVPAGYHDFHPADPYKNNGGRVFQEVAGDFRAEVKISPNLAPKAGHELEGKTNAFHAATLLVWQDDKNFIRLDRTGMWSKGKFVTGVYFHVFKDGKRIFELAPLVNDEETILSLDARARRSRPMPSKEASRW